MNVPDFEQLTLFREDFPASPFSVAGKQKGKEDDRYLWPEMLRVIRELAPRWVVGENVPGIIKLAAGTVVKDLEQAGYHVVVFNFEAAAVGAPHRRSRVAFVGYAEHNGPSSSQIGRGLDETGNNIAERPDTTGEPSGASGRENHAAVANTARPGVERWYKKTTAVTSGRSWEGQPDNKGVQNDDVCYTAKQGLSNGAKGTVGRSKQKQESKRSDWWSVEPDVGRVAHGVPNRVDRLKCLGNAVVPQQFYPIFKAIAETERMVNRE